MPRIAADTVAEHVALMEAKVLDAAGALFAERGIAAVSLGDVASAVGLARNSLYRYVPDKDTLVLRWFERRLAPELARSSDVLAGPGTPAERIVAWVDDQFAFALDPAHAVDEQLLADAGALRPDTRAALMAGHRRLTEPMVEVLAEARTGATPAEVAATAELIGGLLNAATRHVLMGGDRESARNLLRRGVDALLTP